MFFSRSDFCEIQPLAAWDEVGSSFLVSTAFLKERLIFFFQAWICFVSDLGASGSHLFYSSCVPPTQDYVRRFSWLPAGSRSPSPRVCVTWSDPPSLEKRSGHNDLCASHQMLFLPPAFPCVVLPAQKSPPRPLPQAKPSSLCKAQRVPSCRKPLLKGLEGPLSLL